MVERPKAKRTYNIYFALGHFQDDPDIELTYKSLETARCAVQGAGFGHAMCNSNPIKEGRAVVGKTYAEYCDSCQTEGVNCTKIVRIRHLYDERDAE